MITISYLWAAFWLSVAACLGFLCCSLLVVGAIIRRDGDD